MGKIIEIHADDYGISKHATEDILSCIKAGKLDSISVITNMSAYEACAKRLVDEWENLEKKPLLSIHLNLLEGHCVAPKELVPHLVDEKGYFHAGWGAYFKWNFMPGMRETIKKELKAEIKAQTEKFLSFFETYGPLRFDGHQHTQMIPIVYQAILEVVHEQGYALSYIRVTREPIKAYLKKLSLWTSYRPINWVKNILLNMLSSGLEKALEKEDLVCERDSFEEMRDNIPCKNMYMWGVVMSGHMDASRVGILMPLMEQQAKKANRHLEILFHPGSLVKEEMGEEFCDIGANQFHLSDGRRIEYAAVMEQES